MNQEFDKCIQYFKKSIALKYDYPSSHYNLAYAYLYLNKRDSAITEAEISAEQYEDRTYKADAYRLMGITYSELNDTPNTIKYLEISDQVDQSNYYTLKPLLNAYVTTSNDKSEELLNRFFYLAPDNPTIYNDLAEIYSKANRNSDLERFYQSKLADYQDNNKVLGNLYFYLGLVQMGTDNIKAKENIKKAKEVFEKIYPKEHQVFKVINGILENDE